VWTVNAPAEFTRLVAAGAAGIFTDYPERFLHPSPP
jgi:glycerophosphoryl diester phosphodiesterase